MSIVRASKGVITVDRRLIEDGRLTWGARGLMAWIDAQPDSWTFDKNDLVNLCGDAYAPNFSNYEVIDNIVDELLSVGYLEDDGQ